MKIIFIFFFLISCGVQDDSSFRDTDPPIIPSNSGFDTGLSWKKLPIIIHLDSYINTYHRPAFESAVKTWEDAAGINLIDVSNDVIDASYDLDDGFNSISMVSDWESTGKESSILAVTYWQNSGVNGNTITASDIIVNETHFTWVDLYALQDEKSIADFESVLLHELGHLLGFSHVDARFDKRSIMNPTMAMDPQKIKRDLSSGDVSELKKRYKCHIDKESCKNNT